VVPFLFMFFGYYIKQKDRFFSIHHTLDLVITQKKDEKLKTMLFSIENNTVKECWCSFPDSFAPSQKAYADKKSLIAKTTKSKKMLIIENIKKEKEKGSKLRISSHCETEDGSVVTFPIRTNLLAKDVLLVIQVIFEDSFFKINHAKIYKQIFEEFEKRILIEYALKEIKSHAN